MIPNLDASALRAALLYAALLILMLLPLTAAVIVRRLGRKIGIGDGGDRDMARLVRVHGNFAETAPFGIAMLFALALSGAGPLLVHALGAGFLAGRLAHAQGLSAGAGASPGRTAGMVLTLSALACGALAVLWRLAFA